MSVRQLVARRFRGAMRRLSDRNLQVRMLLTRDRAFTEMPLTLDPREVKSALIVAPHPDDETFGCGGTIARLRELDIPVSVVVLTNGSASKGDSDDLFIAQRERECRSALAILGVDPSCVHFFRQPDRDLSASPKIAQELSALVQRVRPSDVFLPYLGEMHRDHVTATKLFAAFLSQSNAPTLCWCYEVWTTLPPNVVVDITSTAGIKRKAIEEFATQTSARSYVDAIDGLNRYRAMYLSDSGTHAEAFLRCDVANLRQQARTLDA